MDLAAPNTVAQTVADYRALGLTLGMHPVGPLRGELAPGHQARAGSTRYIFAGPDLASCRCHPLSSNAWPQNRTMPELFAQLGFVCAVLAGFAFTFVGGLLSSPVQSRAYAWTFGAALFAAVALMVAAVGAVFAGLAVAGQHVAAEQARSLHQLVSQAFLLGVIALLVAAGCVGWLRSRRLGFVSIAVAVLGFVGLAAVVVPFLRLQ